jgi:hypothetical protein
MSIYHLNIRTSSHIADSTEFETDSLTDLRFEMARFVGETLKNHAELLWRDQAWQVDVTDSTGRILYVIQIDASETSATMGSVPRAQLRIVNYTSPLQRQRGRRGQAELGR